MKYLLIILLCFTGVSYAQNFTTVKGNFIYDGTFKAKGKFKFPVQDTTFKPDEAGYVTIRPQDTAARNGMFYTWTGRSWKPVQGGGGGGPVEPQDLQSVLNTGSFTDLGITQSTASTLNTFIPHDIRGRMENDVLFRVGDNQSLTKYKFTPNEFVSEKPVIILGELAINNGANIINNSPNIDWRYNKSNLSSDPLGAFTLTDDRLGVVVGRAQGGLWYGRKLTTLAPPAGAGEWQLGTRVPKGVQVMIDGTVDTLITTSSIIPAGGTSEPTYVTGGVNIGVSGSGTSSAPYIINAPLTTFALKQQVIDTAGVLRTLARGKIDTAYKLNDSTTRYSKNGTTWDVSLRFAGSTLASGYGFTSNGTTGRVDTAAIASTNRLRQKIDSLNSVGSGYALLAGRSGGQIWNGGTSAGEGATINSNSTGTPGPIQLNGYTIIGPDLTNAIIYWGARNPGYPRVKRSGSKLQFQTNDAGTNWAEIEAGLIADMTNGSNSLQWKEAYDKRNDYLNQGYLTQTTANALYSLVNHTHTFASLTSKPTTLAGYGITDAVPTSRTITINGVTKALTSDLVFTISGTGGTDSLPGPDGAVLTLLNGRPTPDTAWIFDRINKYMYSHFGSMDVADIAAYNSRTYTTNYNSDSSRNMTLAEFYRRGGGSGGSGGSGSACLTFPFGSDFEFAPNKGPIVPDANGGRWRLGVTTGGAPTFTSVTSPVEVIVCPPGGGSGSTDSISSPQYFTGGTTWQIGPSNAATIVVYITTPDAAISAGTLRFPPTLKDQQLIEVHFGGAGGITSGVVVNTYTADGNGRTIVQNSAPTVLEVGETLIYRNVLPFNELHRIK